MRAILQIVIIGMVCAALIAGIHAQSTGVTAEAVGQANLRTSPNVEAAKVGEIFSGAQYPVVGKSEYFPWLLLGDPATLAPIGWAFQELLIVRGDLTSVPVSAIALNDSIVNPVSSTLAAPGVTPLPLPTTQALPPASSTPRPTFSVSGKVSGEVNIRYGPGADYPRVGVAFAGEVFQITAYHTQYPWVEVPYSASPNGKAWIARDLLEITGDIFTLPAVTDALLQLPTLTPTPSVVTGGRAERSGSATVSPAFAALGDQIFGLMLDGGFDPETSKLGAFFLMDLQTGEAISVGANFSFSGTSVMKVAILARLYASLNNPPDARMATDIANTMICSENFATNRLLSTIGNGDEFAGAEETTKMFQSLGLTDSFLLSPYIADPAKPPVPTRPLAAPAVNTDQSRTNPDITNQLSVSDIGYLLADIYQCAYEEAGPLMTTFPGMYEPRECRQMLHVMSNNTVDALLKAGVPADTRVAHKHGWIADTHSNAAVFFTPGGDYVMVMTMYNRDWLDFTQSLPIIAEASRLVYNFYNPDAPLDAIRDGFIPEAGQCNYENDPLVLDLRQPIWDR
jgi:beta-lactamase class A/uncharacterized protein YraI